MKLREQTFPWGLQKGTNLALSSEASLDRPHLRRYEQQKEDIQRNSQKWEWVISLGKQAVAFSSPSHRGKSEGTFLHLQKKGFKSTRHRVASNFPQVGCLHMQHICRAARAYLNSRRDNKRKRAEQGKGWCVKQLWCAKIGNFLLIKWTLGKVVCCEPVFWYPTQNGP